MLVLVIPSDPLIPRSVSRFSYFFLCFLLFLSFSSAQKLWDFLRGASGSVVVRAAWIVSVTFWFWGEGWGVVLGGGGGGGIITFVCVCVCAFVWRDLGFL